MNSNQLPYTEVKRVRVKAKIFCTEEPKEFKIIFQCQKGEASFSLWLPNTISLKKNEWLSVEQNFNVNRKMEPDDDIAVYFCNPGGQENIYIDDFEIIYY